LVVRAAEPFSLGLPIEGSGTPSLQHPPFAAFKIILQETE
jgi:hypothetical protein